MAGGPGPAHQPATRTADVHPQERADRTGHLSPHPALQELHGGHDQQIAAAGAAAAPPAGQRGVPHPRPQVQLRAHPLLGSRLSVSEQVEPAPQVQAQRKPPGAGAAAEPSHPADGRGQPAALPLHPGVAGALRLLQLHRGDPQGARKPGRAALVPVRPPVPAALQRAGPRAARTLGPRLQAHVQIHELLHVAGADRARSELCLLLGLDFGGAHCADGVRRGRADGAAHSDRHHGAGSGHHDRQVSFQSPGFFICFCFLPGPF